MNTEKQCCFSAADILLPKSGFDKWSVIACDQYTSQPEYWDAVENVVGNAPSTFRLVFPEVFLGDDNSRRIKSINDTMEQYLKNGVFQEYKQALIYVERTQSDGRIRKGIVGKIDLSAYDYHSGSDASVRATEQTVLERIPPRVQIRKDAPLELPHAMLLIDDALHTVIEPICDAVSNRTPIYDFDLMQNGGHIKGILLTTEEINSVINALNNISQKNNGFLFCVGDGNHSLATAKECYDQNPNDYARFALTEIVNIHDPALDFEPIYRAVFGVDAEELIDAFVSEAKISNQPDAQHFTCIYGNKSKDISVCPSSKLAVGTLQAFLDKYIASHKEVKVDYIHGEESLKKVCSREKTVGFLFEGMKKSELFDAVKADGSLPRKTFSMGHADDKRFYLEARKIK